MAAETELVLAQARVAETNRERAEELAQQRMQDPSDLWANDVKLDDVLGDDKRIDRDKFDQAVTDLLTRKPHLGKRTPQTPAASTVRGEGAPGAEAAPTWVTLQPRPGLDSLTSGRLHSPPRRTGRTAGSDRQPLAVQPVPAGATTEVAEPSGHLWRATGPAPTRTDTIIMAFTVSTPSSASAWRPDHFEFLAPDVVGDALILQTSTQAGRNRRRRTQRAWPTSMTMTPTSSLKAAKSPNPNRIWPRQ